MSFVRTIRPILLFAFLVAVLAGLPAAAQVATSLLNEDEPLPGAPGETVTSLNNPVVNHAGGYALTVNTTGSGTTLSHIWGNAAGGAGTVIISEGLYGSLQQTSFESFHGLSNDGTPAYSAISTDTVSGTTGLDGAWLGPMILLNEEDPVATLPGQFSTFNSRAGITSDGIPYWVGGISPVQGGSSQNRVLFYSAGLTPVLMGGDSVGGVPELIRTASSNIDFDYRFSELGTSYITLVQVDASTSMDGVMVIDGNALFVDGMVVREASPVPASAGGLAGELWDNFDFTGITEGGHWLVTGDTAADSAEDEFVMVDGTIVLREGATIDTPDGPATVSGSIEGGYMNAQGDWAVTWDIDEAGGTNVEVLLINGEFVIKEGQTVDMDGDGVPEPNAVLRNFTGITSLVLADRQPGGLVSAYFTADIDVNGTSSTSDDIEGLYRIDVNLTGAIPVPVDIKPGSCPNSHNPDSVGMLPVALAGTEEFDVTMVDISTLEISRADGTGGNVSPNEGPQGPSSVFQDVATPFDGEVCECTEEYSDGIMDLSMFFDRSELFAVLQLGGFEHNDLVELKLSGALIDGTPFEGFDCMRIVGGSNPLRPVFMRSSRDGNRGMRVRLRDGSGDSRGAPEDDGTTGDWPR